MPIYRYTNDAIDPVEPATFSQLGIAERSDLQRLLRDRIDIIAPDTLVISEEFGNWDDSRRRIDLLAVDRDANLVVIELKRTEDGGHMELQALRYAAMVSTLTFQQAVTVYEDYLRTRGQEKDAEQTLLEFLQWDDAEDDAFASDVRIVLASAEFSKELTTTVLWLCDRGLDIRCVRLRPYGSPAETLLDVQQVIPLPEAEDYQVRVREKKQTERVARKDRQREPWNGQDFYCSFGEGTRRNWDDAVRYGFFCASGGSFYIRTLYHLHDGARLFVNIPKTGYVGVGVVTGPVVPVSEFTISENGRQIPILDSETIAQRAPDFAVDAHNPDVCQHYVPVKWLQTVPSDQAFWQKGLFASQHSACKLRHSHTIKTVTQHFEIAEEP